MGILVFPNSPDPGTSQRLTALEDETIKRSYYQVVSGTSGSIAVSSGVTLVAGQFGSSGNTILSQVDGSSYPLDYSPTDAGGNPVTATLNVSNGAWTASGTYTQLSVAIFFVATGSVKNISLFEAAYPEYISIDDLGKEYVAGSGISIANHVVSISSSYTGQNTINTVGTIATGVWQGTLVGSTYGGTGVNNGSNLLTVPATGTAALLGTANVFTATQSFTANVIPTASNTYDVGANTSTGA